MATTKVSQRIMVWFLPLIVIGGLFYPLLGYLMVVMMIFFLTLSFFKGRFWCWQLCPRGAFLDLVLAQFSKGRAVPRFLASPWFRWSVVVLFMLIIPWRIIATGGDIVAIGGVFVSACIMTTIIAILLGVPTKHRAWCVFCPMGTLQEYLGKQGHKKDSPKIP